MGISCSNIKDSDTARSNKAAATTIGTYYYSKDGLEASNISLHWAYMGLPVYLKDQNEMLEPSSIMLVISLPLSAVLDKPTINWGLLKIRKQVPEVLPSEISSHTFTIFATLQNVDSLKSRVTIKGYLNGLEVTGEAYVTNSEGNNPDAMMDTVRLMQNYLNDSKNADIPRNNSSSSIETGYVSTLQKLSIHSADIIDTSLENTKESPRNSKGTSAESCSNDANENSRGIKESDPDTVKWSRTASNNTLKSFSIRQGSRDALDDNEDSSDEPQDIEDIHEEVRRNSTGYNTSWCDMYRSRSLGTMRRWIHRRRSSDITLSDSSMDEMPFKVPKVPKNPRLRKRSFLAVRAFQAKCAMTEQEKREPCNKLPALYGLRARRVTVATSVLPKNEGYTEYTSDWEARPIPGDFCCDQKRDCNEICYRSSTSYISDDESTIFSHSTQSVTFTEFAERDGQLR